MTLDPPEIELIKNAVGLYLPEAREGEAKWNRLFYKASTDAASLNSDELIIISHYTAKFLRAVDGKKNPPLKNRLRLLEKKLGELMDDRVDREARSAYGKFLMDKLADHDVTE